VTTLQPEAAMMGCMAPSSPPTLDELRRLAPALQSITAAHGGLGLQVFGSVVHGSAGPGSDLDLLVEFPNSPSFEQFMDLKLALEDLLSVPVDLVTHRAGCRVTPGNFPPRCSQNRT
jgi:predicted nucleotidyltransferase